MRIENRTRSTLLGLRVEVAATWWSRLRGFLGRPEPAPGEGILLFPCNGVHTYGMNYDLDVLFLDDEGRVLELIRSLQPWRRTGRVPRARYVLETRPGMIDQSGTQVGDMLTWWDPAPPPVSEKLTGRGERNQQPVVGLRGSE
jgi:uncharacterized membrane protein (UPF0127 family)